MTNRRPSRPKNPRRKWILLISTIAICTALLFWLEWLGSERPQHIIEQPLAVPAVPTKTG